MLGFGTSGQKLSWARAPGLEGSWWEKFLARPAPKVGLAQLLGLFKSGMAVDRWRLHETQQCFIPSWKFYMYTAALFRIRWWFSYTRSFSLRDKWQHINVCSSSPPFLWASPGCWTLYEDKLPSATEALPVCLLLLRTACAGSDNLWVCWECHTGTGRRMVLQERWRWVRTGG